MNIEFIDNFFLGEGLVAEKMRRIEHAGNRYYVDSQNNFFMGITSFLAKMLPSDFWLEQWKKDIGEKRAAEILKERADYGTRFHVLCANALRNFTVSRSYSVPITEHEIKTTAKSFGFEVNDWQVEELQYDLASFAAWCEEYKPEPILLESSIKSKNLPLAATLDFFGTIEVSETDFFGDVYLSGAKKGEPKQTKKHERCYAIVDFKTMVKKENNFSNKNIGVQNEFQLNYQKMFLLENFPEFASRSIKLFNAIPKNWHSTPDMQVTEIKYIFEKTLIGFVEVAKVIHPEIFKIADKEIIKFNSYSGNIRQAINKIKLKDLL